jgi:hypothetical protein
MTEQFIYYAPTPKNTSATNPILTQCALTYGTLSDIFITLPQGCKGLVGVQLYKESQLVFPANQNNWFTGDTVATHFEEAIDCTDGIITVVIATYNLDSQYSHTPFIVFTVEQPQVCPTAPSSTTSETEGEEGGGGDITPVPVNPTPTCPDGCEWDDDSQSCVPISPTPTPPSPTPPSPTPTPTNFEVYMVVIIVS